MEIGQIIAERTLTLKDQSGEKKLIVMLGAPRRETNPGGDWECPYQIGSKIKVAYGLDSFQALQLTQRMLLADLMYLKDKQGMALTWLDMELEKVF